MAWIVERGDNCRELGWIAVHTRVVLLLYFGFLYLSPVLHCLSSGKHHDPVHRSHFTTSHLTFLVMHLGLGLASRLRLRVF